MNFADALDHATAEVLRASSPGQPLPRQPLLQTFADFELDPHEWGIDWEASDTEVISRLEEISRQLRLMLDPGFRDSLEALAQRQRGDSGTK